MCGAFRRSRNVMFYLKKNMGSNSTDYLLLTAQR